MNTKKLMAIATLIEFIGMVVLLSGALWQAKMSGWWDQQLPEWQAYIQEDVNLAVLGSLKDISAIAVISDQDLKSKLATGVEKRTWDAMSKAIHERERRSKAMRVAKHQPFGISGTSSCFPVPCCLWWENLWL